MRLSTLPIVVVLSLTLLSISVPGAVSSAMPGPDAGVAAKQKGGKQKAGKGKAGKKAKPKATRKACKKGYVRKTVTIMRKGKPVRVKRCRKKAGKKRPATTPSKPTPPSSPTSPAPPVLPPWLPDDPTRTAVLAKLADSRFTNCPAGGCNVEERYSHQADGAFFNCRFTKSGVVIKNVKSTYSIQSPAIGADGSWSFEGVVPDHGTYRWQVAADGKVTGSFRVDGESRYSDIDINPPLQHAAGAPSCDP